MRRRRTPKRKSPQKKKMNDATHYHSYERLDDVATGVWWFLETMAYHSNTPEKSAIFSYNKDFISDYFICSHCREHFKEFCKAEPLEDYIIDEQDHFDPLGCFRWIWRAHNHANEITHKEFYPFDKAIEFQQRQPLKSKEGNKEGCNTCTLHKETDEANEGSTVEEEVKGMSPTTMTTTTKSKNVRITLL